MRISDWSSDVCSSDLPAVEFGEELLGPDPVDLDGSSGLRGEQCDLVPPPSGVGGAGDALLLRSVNPRGVSGVDDHSKQVVEAGLYFGDSSEEHKCELPSLMSI